MAKKGTKLQVVDLGTHFVKAALVEVQGASFPIIKAAAVPLPGLSTDADSHIAEIRSAWRDLVDFFDRKVPIYFVLPETIARVGISYLNNLAAEAVDQAMHAESQKFVSAAGLGQFAQTTSRSYRVREKSQGKNLQVVSANVLASNEHLESLAELVTSKKLTLGGFFPRLFAFHSLFKACVGPAANSTVACLVDVGYTSTSVIAFKDQDVVFHKVLHLGAVDFYKELVELERQGKYKMELGEFGLLMAAQGFSDSDEPLQGLGLPISNPKGYVESILGQADQLFTKIQLSIDYFSTVAATDFNTSMSTVMAVRKGPEMIAFTGGMARCEKFTDLVTQYFGKGALILDPGSTSPMTGPCVKTELDAHFFHACVGGAALAADEASASYNLGSDLSVASGSGSARSAGSAGGSSAGGPEPFVPSWAGLLFVAVIGGMAFFWWDTGQKLKRLNADLSSKQNQLDQAYTLITQYRDLKVKEYQARTRLELIEELTKNQVPWPRFFQDLQGALAEDVKVFRISIETQLPEADQNTDTPAATGVKPKVVTFKMCGEALNQPSVSGFVNRLLKSNRFVEISPPDIVLAGEGTGTERGPCADPEGTGIKLQKHFAFQISGKLAY